MKKKRHSAKRIIGGILFTAAFIVFAFISCKVAVHSSDLENCEDTYLYRVYGYDRNRYLRNQGRADEIETDYAVSDETGTVTEIPAAAPAAAVVPESTPAATTEPTPAAFPNRRISTSTTGSMCLSTVIIPWTRLTTLRPISCISTWLATTPKSAPDMTETGRLSTR